MRRAALHLLVVAVLIGALACGKEPASLTSSPTTGTGPDATGPSPTRERPAPPPPPPNQVAIAYDGVMVWDAASGETVLATPGAVPSPDWSTVITSPITEGSPMSAIDTNTGAVRWTTRRAGSVFPRVTSQDGSIVVLATEDGDVPVEPQPPTSASQIEFRGYGIDGRTHTVLHVVTDGGAPRIFDLDANVEPEAVSLDGKTVFVIQYTPPRAPSAYRVRQLDLASGSLSDVYTDDRELLDDMPGAARKQVRSPDGRRLYTLYNEAPATDQRSEHDGPNIGRAFVHVLDLQHKWAKCIDLPAAFAGGSRRNGGLAISADSGTLVAADAENETVATMDTTTLRIARERHLDLPPVTEGGTHPTIARDGSVFVATARNLEQIDRDTLEPRTGPVIDIPQGSAVSAIDGATRDGELAIAMYDHVLVYDVRSSRLLRTLQAGPMVNPITHLGTTDSRLWRVPHSDKCTC